MDSDDLFCPFGGDESPQKRCRRHPKFQAGAETESEKIVQEMLTKQLDTRFSVKQLTEQQRHFTTAGDYAELPVGGTYSLNEYKAVGSQAEQKRALSLCGLTSDEIGLYLQSGDVAAMKQKHPLMEPSLLESKLEHIQDKIRSGGQGVDDVSLKRFVSGEHHSALVTGGVPQTEEDACQSSPQATVLPKDPMTHIADFSQRLMERVMSKRKKKRKQLGPEKPSSVTVENKEQVLNDSCKEDPAVQTLPDPTVYHVVVPIPENEIAAERVSVDEIRKLPRFQNYSPGARSRVLYLKNLHPKVDVRELMALFCRFDEDACTVKYRLLSGKLRGQAFVTLPSIQAASKALDLCNGYVLRGKPMIIEYGKNST